MKAQTQQKRKTATTRRPAKSAAPTATALAAVAGLGALGGIAFYFRREIMDQISSLVSGLTGLATQEVEPQIAAKLPIANDLQTVTDLEGNYDLDGVSYDIEGVIVSSDETKHVSAPL